MVETNKPEIPTIVFVEDSASDTLLLEEALRVSKLDAQLLTISRGDQALRYFEIKESARDLPPPHCILLDHYLPRVTGGNLLRFLRASPVFDKTPIYIFGNQADYADLISQNRVGLETFISKPGSWAGFIELAHCLMSAARNCGDDQDHPAASPRT
jgi:CheY-like chemotaxis protein